MVLVLRVYDHHHSQDLFEESPKDKTLVVEVQVAGIPPLVDFGTPALVR